MRAAPFAEFRREEHETRLAKVRALMTERGIDAALLTSDVNLRYVGGVVNCYWVATMADDLQCLLVPGSGAPVVMQPDHLAYGASGSSWIEDKRAWSQFSVGKMPGPIATIAECIAQKGLDKATIAMEIGPDARLGMSPAYFDALKAAVPGVTFVDAEAMMSDARRVKSDAEIALMRRAGEITCEGLKAGLSAIEKGISEIGIAQRIVARWGEIGDDFSSHRPFFLFVYSSPQRSQWFDCGPSHYRLQKGDYCVIDLGFCCKGYWADMFRTACIGEPDDAIRRFHDANVAANLAGIDSIRPGVTGAHVANVVNDVFRERGLKKQLDEQLVENDYDFVGHGIGLTLHDQPLINTQQTMTLEAGMVVAIEAMMVDHMPFKHTTIGVGTEDDILVTPAGCENLTPLAHELLVC